jgi:hypothetical protein
MDDRIKITFLILVLTQGLHSLEEYVGRLWEVFPPAKLLSSLVSENHRTGFVILNIGLFLFGLWCWLFPARKNYPSAQGFLLFWIVIEMINSTGHLIWALYEKQYVPGVATAPVLLFLAVYLSRRLLRFDPGVSNQN